MFKSSAQNRREKLKAEYWPQEAAWTGDKEKGWFRAPRTLPLILTLLSAKELSGSLDPQLVYLELLARHRDSGIVEMIQDGEHAYAAGYTSPRGVRSWYERMALLEELGFIRSISGGNVRYRIVLLVHPAVAIKRLRDSGRVPDGWWNLYRSAQIEGKETQHEAFEQPPAAPTVEPEKAAAASEPTKLPAKILPLAGKKAKEPKKRA